MVIIWKANHSRFNQAKYPYYTYNGNLRLLNLNKTVVTNAWLIDAKDSELIKRTVGFPMLEQIEFANTEMTEGGLNRRNALLVANPVHYLQAPSKTAILVKQILGR